MIVQECGIKKQFQVPFFVCNSTMFKINYGYNMSDCLFMSQILDLNTSARSSKYRCVSAKILVDGREL